MEIDKQMPPTPTNERPFLPQSPTHPFAIKMLLVAINLGLVDIYIYNNKWAICTELIISPKENGQPTHNESELGWPPERGNHDESDSQES